MGLLKFFFIVFILLFPVAEVGRFQFSSGIAIGLNDVLLFLVVLSWLVNKLFNKEKYKKLFLSKSIFIFTGVAFVSLILNLHNLTFFNFFVSFLYLVRWVFYGLIYFIVKEFDVKFKSNIVIALLFSGSIVVLLGYIQYFFYPSLANLYYLGWDEHLYRMFSTFLDPNFAGTFFVIFFLFSLINTHKYLSKKFNAKFIVSVFISAASLGAIYLSYSRSALLMLFLSSVTFLILIKKGKYLLIFLITFVLLLFISPKSFKTEGTNILRITSSEARSKTMQQGTDIFLSSPVFGVGFNAYRYAQNKRGLNNIFWQVTHAGAGTDNSFIFVLATTGLIGFSAYIYLLANMIKLSYANLRKSKYAAVLLSVLIGLFLNSIFINSLFYVLIIEWVWILAAFTESS